MQLEKLRRIFFLPSDYNICLGMLIGRRLVWNMEATNSTHKDQWGSRPGRSAMDATTMKELTYMIARETNTPLATCDNDAKSCYDRIVILLALLLARQ